MQASPPGGSPPTGSGVDDLEALSAPAPEASKETYQHTKKHPDRRDYR